MMESILQITQKLPKNQQEFLEDLFCDAPRWLFDSFRIKYVEKGQVIIRENTPVNKVFLMIEGMVQAVDHRIFGIEYDYMQFHAIKMFGSMEILMDIEDYRTTLKTYTDCTFLILDKDSFMKWIRSDIHALLIEVKEMSRYLLENSRKERIFLFLGGTDRLFFILAENYEYRKSLGKKCVLTYTRQELSDFSGLSVKTINRAVKKMEEEGYIGRDGNKILISDEQYGRMKAYIDTIIERE